MKFQRLLNSEWGRKYCIHKGARWRARGGTPSWECRTLMMMRRKKTYIGKWPRRVAGLFTFVKVIYSGKQGFICSVARCPMPSCGEITVRCRVMPKEPSMGFPAQLPSLSGVTEVLTFVPKHPREADCAPDRCFERRSLAVTAGVVIRLSRQ